MEAAVSMVILVKLGKPAFRVILVYRVTPVHF
jgi:hypothetical protein